MKLFGKRKPAPTRRETLRTFPVRNPGLEYEEQDGIVVLHVPLASSGLLSRIVSKAMPESAERCVELEELGSFVWRLCDGKHSCQALVGKLCEHYKLNKAEAEASLLAFLETLARRRFIFFANGK